jgi:putative membrane protein
VSYPLPVEEPRHRLHPLTPILRSAKALVVIVGALSFQTLGQVGLGWFSLMVLVLLIGSTILSVVSWVFTGYQFVGRELRVHEGLIWRRTRAIPLERLQTVEVVRPLLAQLTGLAELRLEVVGGGKTEAPLAYLTVADAAALRHRLLTLAGPVIGDVVGDAPPAYPTMPATPRERMVHMVTNRDLLISQLLTPQALMLPFGVAFVVVQFLSERTWSFLAVASTVTAMAGVLLQPVRRVLTDWNFRLAHGDGGLRLRAGLLETRSQTVPLVRVQAVRAVWPLLWRTKGWLRLRLDVAGYAVTEEQQKEHSDRLVPVSDEATARRVVAEVLPGVSLDRLGITLPPRRTRWLHPIGWRALGAGLSDQVFAAREGRLTRELVLVPYARIQSVRVVQGPVQRRMRLATVHADTAGGRSAVAHDRDVTEAWALAAELSDRARLARLAA